MDQKLAITNLKKISVHDKIVVKGKVAPGARRFAINLGENASNYLIHFNPRFDQQGGVIVCNCLIKGSWGTEMQISQLPFRRGQEVTISFLFEGNKVKVHYPDEYTFPSKLQLDYIDYISVEGDFEVHSICLE